MDPPRAWGEAHEALAGLASWPFRSDNAAMFFPRLTAFDRLRNRPAIFAPGAAAAGMLARTDCTRGPCRPIPEPEAALRSMLRPASVLDAEASARLAQAGINTLAPLRPGSVPRMQTCTLAAGVSATVEGRYLAAHRLGLHLANSIERGTRWVLTAPNTAATWSAPVTRSSGSWSHCTRAERSRPETSRKCVWWSGTNASTARVPSPKARVNLLFGYALQQPGTCSAGW